MCGDCCRFRTILCMLSKNSNLYGGWHWSIMYYPSTFIPTIMSLIISYLYTFFLTIIYLIINYISTFSLISIMVKGCIHSITCILRENSNLCGRCRWSITKYISTFILIIIYLIINYLSIFLIIRTIFRGCIRSVMSMLSANSRLCRGCHWLTIHHYCSTLFLAKTWLK